ncbi:MAG: monofunctional biosynthetic peptidoglycan transglycosylase [Nitrospirota bacterium]|nr:monofunctional biosynthetic peptidoglycan transglycosylase [Nitrospirota bacterium]
MRRRKRKKSSFKKVCWILVVFLISGISAYLYFSFPDIESLKRHNPKKTSFMEYREREWKRQGKKYRIQQKWVPVSQISPYLIKAVLIAEDDKFWSHEGFDYEAMQKAMEKDIKAGKFKAGGSTISQQLAKNLYLSPSKNPMRKMEEAVITWRMEKILSKKRILELYLNVAEWGDTGIFGIEAAAGHYYGKSASALTPEESARLASVLPNPRKYNPAGDSKYVVNRSNLIYNIMIKRGIVVPEYEEVWGHENKEENPPDSAGQPETQRPANQ